MDSASLKKNDGESLCQVASVADMNEEKVLVRKIDMMLMPALWLMYLFSYADRTK
jgi:hypothetical protein